MLLLGSVIFFSNLFFISLSEAKGFETSILSGRTSTSLLNKAKIMIKDSKAISHVPRFLQPDNSTWMDTSLTPQDEENISSSNTGILPEDKLPQVNSSIDLESVDASIYDNITTTQASEVSQVQSETSLKEDPLKGSGANDSSSIPDTQTLPETANNEIPEGSVEKRQLNITHAFNQEEIRPPEFLNITQQENIGRESRISEEVRSPSLSTNSSDLETLNQKKQSAKVEANAVTNSMREGSSPNETVALLSNNSTQKNYSLPVMKNLTDQAVSKPSIHSLRSDSLETRAQTENCSFSMERFRSTSFIWPLILFIIMLNHS